MAQEATSNETIAHASNDARLSFITHPPLARHVPAWFRLAARFRAVATSLLSRPLPIEAVFCHSAQPPTSTWVSLAILLLNSSNMSTN